MINYQYQVLRYMPDQFTGEFANLGIVLYAPQSNYLACRFTNRYGRLSEFFGEVNGSFLMASLKRIESRIKEYSEQDITAKNNSLELITTSILPKDDSALQFSESYFGIDVEPEITLHDLFERLIERYNHDNAQPRHNDKYAWRNVYKKHFEKYGIADKLKKHTVATSKDAIEFDKAWKNGVWNCFQPLALDLSTTEAIKNKVYRWSGIIRELETTTEPVHVYFLTTTPKNGHSDLNLFIRDTLKHADKRLIVDIIEEKEADAFAAKVRRDMEASNVVDDEPY